MIDKKNRAISSLFPEASFTILNDGAIVSVTPEVENLKEETINAEIDRLDVEDIKTKYQRDRQYPYFGDQLDDLYHKGAFSDEMAVKIKAVKDAHPKPE